MATPYIGPDLASILRNLSAYTTPAVHQPAPVAPPQVQSSTYSLSPSGPEEGEIDEYEPPEISTFQTSFQEASSQLPRQQQVLQHPVLHQPAAFPQPLRAHPQQPQTPPSLQRAPFSDPCKPPTPSSQQSITTWPPALRHVTSLSAHNPSFIPRIKQLIRSQHTHERQWWHGREQLVMKIQNREASRKKLGEVLAAVGGGTLAKSHEAKDGEKRKRGKGEEGDDEGLAEEKETEIDAEGKKELLQYDRKVLRASKEMAFATEKELENLGVPFFGKDVEKLITEKVEMDALRERMVAFLEELCGE